MDTWNKYKNKEFKKDLKQTSIAKAICYGNMLMAQLAWAASEGKLKQKDLDKFFEQASLVIQATIEQKGFERQEANDIYTYIDKIFKDISSDGITNVELGLMLGNLTELEDGHYTFVELIGFARVLASKI